MTDNAETPAELIRTQFTPTAAGSTTLRQRRANALQAIAALAEIRRTAEELIARNIHVARGEVGGSYYDYSWPTWEDIGKRLGVTRQAAQARYGKKT